VITRHSFGGVLVELHIPPPAALSPNGAAGSFLAARYYGTVRLQARHASSVA